MIKTNMLLCAAGALALASCAGGNGRGPASPATSARMVEDSPVKIGPPYTVRGVTYTPADDLSYDAVGQAGWYGEEHEGNSTANGENFNPAGVSAAHTTLPLPSYVEVTALATGRTIVVRINDRGPFDGRLIDLSRGAAEQLGIIAQGKADVRVRRVNPPEQDRAKLRTGQRAGARIDAPEPLLAALRRKLAEQRQGAAMVAPTSVPVPASSPAKPATTSSVRPQAIAPSSVAIAAHPASAPHHGDKADKVHKPQAENKISSASPAPAAPKAKQKASLNASPTAKAYAVQVAAFSSQERAAATAKKLGGTVSRAGMLWRVRTGPYADRTAARRGVERAASSGFQGAQIVVSD